MRQVHQVNAPNLLFFTLPVIGCTKVTPFHVDLICKSPKLLIGSKALLVLSWCLLDFGTGIIYVINIDFKSMQV